MAEADAIAKSDVPRTRASLSRDLRLLGLPEGGTVLVHTSLSALGWVNGGAQSVIEALLDALGPAGTLVMPTQSGQLTDPAAWRAPPVPAAWLDTIRETMPPYDPRLTPTRGMGAVPELFRTWPGALRSAHPHASFAAIGPHTAAICDGHELTSPLGERSPLARCYEFDAMVLLLGVGFDSCTALHLAEQRAFPGRPLRPSGAPLVVEGRYRWVAFEEPPFGDNDDFLPIGEMLVADHVVRAGTVGSARALIGPIRAIVDRAVDFWRTG